MGYDKQRFLNMLAAGMCSKGRVGTQIPPTAYLAAGMWKGNGLYIYGTPIEGMPSNPFRKVGLRSGDTVTYYDGEVMPLFPNWDTKKYPNAILNKALFNTFLHVFDTYTPAQTLMADGTYSPTVKFMDGAIYTSVDYYGNWNEWRDGTDTETTSGTYQSQIYWTTTDIRTMSGNLTIAKCGAPIPVSKKVTYRVSDFLLPEWDMEKFPYALITNNNGVYTLYCFSVMPSPIDPSNLTLVPKNDGDVGTYISATVGAGGSNTFSEPASFTAIEETASQEFVWNTNWLSYKDGKKFREASTLLPIYE